MKKLQFSILFLIIFNWPIYAQVEGPNNKCSFLKQRFASKTTVNDIREDNYDIKYVKLNISLSNTSTNISGNVLTQAVSMVSALNQYVFELLNVLVVDSVIINGSALPVSTVGDVRTVNIPSPITLGTLFTAQVVYHGTAPSGTLYNNLGINSLTSPSWGVKATFTLSESYHAKEWWPCKQSLRDKIDSLDVWITVPDTLKAGSNGVLKNITTIDSFHKRYEWKESNPIDYYLLSAAVGPYIDYSYYMHFTGSTDSMLVQNYIYNTPGTLPYFKSVLDSTGSMIDYFSTLYGRYPFWKEKYGHCIAPISGGMEHQTMTTIGFFEGSIVAHELAHQWFGDHVTCGDWSDIFMNEGFASYSEDLFRDHFRSHADFLNDMQVKQSDVLTFDTGAIFFTDTADENRIFNLQLSYDKGACVLHQLRFVLNNDSLFFAIFKNYQHTMKDSTGVIDDFKNIVKNTVGLNINGINLDTFFNQWFYLRGHPTFGISWNQKDSDVYIQLIQVGSNVSSVPFFTLPVELQFHSSLGDTIIRVLNTADTQLYHFVWNKPMSNLYFDPNYWLIYTVYSNEKVPDLNITAPICYTLKVAPNPTTNNWTISNLPFNANLELFDITGQLIWEGNNKDKEQITIPGNELVEGIFILKISNEKTNYLIKLIKN